MLKPTIAMFALLAATASVQAQTTAPGAIAKGEGPAATAKTVPGETTRAMRKSDAASAVKAGAVVKGEGSPPVARNRAGDKTRAQVKQEAADAVKTGKVGKGPDVKP